MGLCICGGDDQVTHSHPSPFGGLPILVAPKINWTPPVVFNPANAAPAYSTHWRPWCAKCAETAAKAGLFLFGAQCLHTDLGAV